jgi:NAD(P)H-dependent glutamate synthase small subunit
MGNPVGFMLHARKDAGKRLIAERVRDFREIELRLNAEQLETQASRCMDCGLPYCHAYGCPVEALVPDFNERVYRHQWRRALDVLHSANNLPEVTGRICPGLCEAACSLSISQEAVSIRQIELEVIERGWKEGWVRPEPATRRTGRKIAIIGSGPAGLSAAQQLARRGHQVVVFERDRAVGGVLRYGIPDFKLEKWVIDRRLEQLRAEGVTFETGVEAGTDLSARYLRTSFDALLLATGSRAPRDLKVPGRELGGIHFAMDFLSQQNRINAGEVIRPEERISAKDKDVVVIGGGDTGADCIGTCRRQGAREVRQVEILPEPPAKRTPQNPWPTWPLILRTSTSHEEGCERLWSATAKEFSGSDGRVGQVRCVRVRWSAPDAAGQSTVSEISGSEFDLKADLVLLAMGFLHAEHGPLVQGLELRTDPRGNIQVSDTCETSAPGVFAAGDAVLGTSLVVRAIKLGRSAAEAVDAFLER